MISFPKPMCIFLSCVLLFLDLGSHGSALATSLVPPIDSKGYIILIDAGSSGSRVHVHSYTLAPKALPDVKPSKSKKVKPGLSSFASTPSQAGVSLKPLIEFAMEQIPTELHSSTHLHLMATAGLRMLSPLDSDGVLTAVREELAKSPFVFSPSNAAIITGTEEGLNGWVAANYLDGVFARPTATALDTRGIIEMGGASTQLTFAPSDTANVLSSHLHPVTVGNHNFQVYTYSYLNYGLEQAQKVFQRTHIDRIEQVGNPCYLVQFSHSATGDYTTCREWVEQLLEQSTCVYDSCSFNGIYQPKFGVEKFYAIENFFWISEFFAIQADTPVGQALEEKGKAFCKKNWNDELSVLGTSHPKDNADSLKRYCFGAAYIPALLQSGFKFTNAQIKDNVVVTREINGEALDWALGAVVRLLSTTPSVPPTYSFTVSNSSTLFLALLALAVLVAYCYVSRHKHHHKPSPPIRPSTRAYDRV